MSIERMKTRSHMTSEDGLVSPTAGGGASADVRGQVTGVRSQEFSSVAPKTVSRKSTRVN